MERTSTEAVVTDIMNQKRDTSNNVDLCIAPEDREKYLHFKGYGKEYMGQSLLLALAFLRICLVRCPESLAIINRTGRN